ncbi:hypothetical protein [Legionella tunisiensis]|uniref:hypothetical protein n=1 Tax=Legionella tunisiensis TaxID=1034944 RepID=UPI0002D61D5F|nr:hypothetical protein [Legionella tunisiensis]
MTDFFKDRTKLQLAGDVALGALGGARKGVFGSLLLSAAESSIPTLGTIATMAGACALGGALLIVPAMVVHKMLISEPKRDASFLAQMTTLTANICFRTAFCVYFGLCRSRCFRTSNDSSRTNQSYCFINI